jgi:DNA polymerase V
LTRHGRKIKKTVEKWTGVPVSIGIAQTKTLAEISNRIAKKSVKADGVLDLTDVQHLSRALAETPVEKVWGVGIKTAIKLKRAGIKTALDLSKAEIGWIKNKFGVVGARTVYELRGICCYPLEDNPPVKKSICVSRMFGTPVESVEQLKEAIASYAARAGEKLREQGLAAGLMTVFVMTSRFIKDSYFNSHTIEFPVAANDTRELIHSARQCIERLYRKNCAFKKCGIVLNGLIPEGRIQANMFDNTDRDKSRRLMQVVDAVNARLNCPLQWAAEGLEQSWQVKFSRRSRGYTTRWDELTEVA